MARLKTQANSSGKSILLVDDQEEYRITTSSLLTREGHEVLTAESGETALEILKSRNFDLLLIDFYMYGGMNGDEMVRELRKFNSYIHVILQTGYSGDTPLREMLKHLDIQGYHNKADGPESLLLWVEIGLKAANTMQQLNRDKRSLQYLLGTVPEMYSLKQFDELLKSILLQASGFLGILNTFATIVPEIRKNSSSERVSSSFLALLKDNILQIKVATGDFNLQGSFNSSSEILESSLVHDTLNTRCIQISEKVTILPLSAGDKMLGIIYLEESLISKENLEHLNLFANQAAVAIQCSHL